MLDWLRASEVTLTGGPWGRGTVRGGPYQDDVTAGVTSVFDPNRPAWQLASGLWVPAGHLAVDMSAGRGAWLLCLGDGVVQSMSIADDRGNSHSIVVDHQNGWTSCFRHMLNAPPFAVGQPVVKGQPLGQEDTTGLADGSHLHLEMTYGGSRVDPLTMLLAGPDLVPAPQPIPAPQVGDPSPSLTINERQQLQALFANGTVVFEQAYTAAQGNERYYSLHDGVPRLLPAGTLCRGYSVFIPLEAQP